LAKSHRMLLMKSMAS